MAKNKKIVRYRKPLNINVGMIIFAMIFVYLSFSVYTYLRRDHVQFYEVVEGSIESCFGMRQWKMHRRPGTSTIMCARESGQALDRASIR